MTDAPESSIEPTAVATSQGWDRPNRLNQVAAWVGIIAGVVFIVAAVFFSGVYAGKTYGDRYRDGRGMNGSCSMTGPGMMGPGGMSPGMMGPGGNMGPGQQAPTTTAATPAAPRS